jgi:hypothetical protein
VGPALNCTCKLPRAFDCRNICDPEANGTLIVTFAPSGRSYNSSRRLECEPIVEPRYRSEVGRTGWIVLQLVPEFHNVIVDTTVSGVPVFIAAHSLQHFNNSARVMTRLGLSTKNCSVLNRHSGFTHCPPTNSE